MGTAQGKESFETPSPNHTATLYYFAGRGLSDQIRWMLAATDVSFTQKNVTSREHFLKMAEKQLPFGQLPLLQIDNLELVQSQAIVRYLANRAGIAGKTDSDRVKCDMIVEVIKDFLPMLTAAPFRKYKKSSSGETEDEEWTNHLDLMLKKWNYLGLRLEAILKANLPQNPDGKKSKSSSVFLVGNDMTYADVLVAHIVTWVAELCGPDQKPLEKMPLLIALQCRIISLPGVKTFIQSVNYFPPAGAAYVEQVNKVLAKN